MKFALFLGNRGFFPERLIVSAKQQVIEQLAKLGIDTLCLPEGLTHYGAVEGYAEGLVFNQFLEKHKGEFDGVILCLPNFGDETGAAEALRDCGVPIYILAFPDELDKMDFNSRRDAFCGKLSVMDVFHQFRIPYTAWAPHTLSPLSPVFLEHMRQFAAVCRIVKGMKRIRIGAIGARPTAFKTIRFDEATLQKYGVTTETFDNSDLLVKMDKLDADSADIRAKIDFFNNYSNFSEVPKDAMISLAKASVAIDQFIKEYSLDAIGLRCWNDLQLTAKISPCVLLSELNDRGIPAGCELDVCNAVGMLALHLASQEPATCIDWNNNYEVDPDKCIVFHCGSLHPAEAHGRQGPRRRPCHVQEGPRPGLLLRLQHRLHPQDGFLLPLHDDRKRHAPLLFGRRRFHGRTARRRLLRLRRRRAYRRPPAEDQPHRLRGLPPSRQRHVRPLGLRHQRSLPALSWLRKDRNLISLKLKANT